MKRMTVEELYDYLCSPQFLDEKSGNIFYNYYIYQYPASNEYEMRRQIQEFREKLERPTNFVNALELDLFKVFCEYFDIPYRTVTDWELGNRHCPEYVLRLLEYYIQMNGLAKNKGDK